MKHIIKIMLFAALFSQMAFGASCEVDKTQMYDQISKYKSISTKGCPLNSRGWGITRVFNVEERDVKTCSATCVYAFGPGSQGMTCEWERGNWGDTLNCS